MNNTQSIPGAPAKPTRKLGLTHTERPDALVMVADEVPNSLANH